MPRLAAIAEAGLVRSWRADPVRDGRRGPGPDGPDHHAPSFLLEIFGRPGAGVGHADESVRFAVMMVAALPIELGRTRIVVVVPAFGMPASRPPRNQRRESAVASANASKRDESIAPLLPMATSPRRGGETARFSSALTRLSSRPTDIPGLCQSRAWVAQRTVHPAPATRPGAYLAGPASGRRSFSAHRRPSPTRRRDFDTALLTSGRNSIPSVEAVSPAMRLLVIVSVQASLRRGLEQFRPEPVRQTPLFCAIGDQHRRPWCGVARRRI